MKIYIDADACPQVIKNIVYRAAARTKVELILVANAYFQYPKANNIKFVQVGKGFDVADSYIVQQVQLNDIVITADVPLAALVIDKGACALNPRGEFYDKESIKQKLAIRNLMTELRESGQISSRTAPFDQRAQQAFANALDKYLTKMQNK